MPVKKPRKPRKTATKEKEYPPLNKVAQTVVVKTENSIRCAEDLVKLVEDAAHCVYDVLAERQVSMSTLIDINILMTFFEAYTYSGQGLLTEGNYRDYADYMFSILKNEVKMVEEGPEPEGGTPEWAKGLEQTNVH